MEEFYFDIGNDSDIRDCVKRHIDRFGIEPVIIGLFWDNQMLERENIIRAINSGVPYDERRILKDEFGVDYSSVLL